MKRPITYAELILVVAVLISGIQVAPHLYKFVSDRVSIEVNFK